MIIRVIGFLATLVLTIILLDTALLRDNLVARLLVNVGVALVFTGLWWRFNA